MTAKKNVTDVTGKIICEKIDLSPFQRGTFLLDPILIRKAKSVAFIDKLLRAADTQNSERLLDTLTACRNRAPIPPLVKCFAVEDVIPVCNANRNVRSVMHVSHTSNSAGRIIQFNIDYGYFFVHQCVVHGNTSLFLKRCL